MELIESMTYRQYFIKIYSFAQWICFSCICLCVCVHVLQGWYMTTLQIKTNSAESLMNLGEKDIEQLKASYHIWTAGVGRSPI